MRIAIPVLAAVTLAGCFAEAPSAPGNDGIANVATPLPVGNDSAGNSIEAVAGPLSAYVGKYAFDKVADVSFLQHPLVRAGVDGAVPDAKIREWVLENAGPQTPIALRDGRLISWGCQQHNCGMHQWTVVIAQDGSNAEVCYLPDGAETPVWYAGGKKTGRADLCPSGED
eukprot:Opistho-1_new@53208